MGRLLFSAIASLDGYTADAEGTFGWAAPDEEVHAFINDRERETGTALYGRRMYETMRVWQELPGPDDPPVIADYARIWRDTDKVVFSSTLDAVTTPRTRLEPVFDPVAVRSLVDDSSADVSIGGPTLAAAALRAGLVDEVSLFVVPVSVGGGTPALPRATFLRLDLVEERTFTSSVVLLRYRVSGSAR
ncbi:deaminase [Leifsonia sp. LS1]|uniref:dihydrofolate reductase family protein n=1 Tax=Leifsonia sp. LS1 TaxID=2828483 RepID=UPI001CFE6E6F|nr:dihydrofolate reductase family protein [Leifsonia sp. LS1]GIT78410.1 deaminase [Leifsonia sp. LS1]